VIWRTVPPSGEEREGTMNRATIADGFEKLQFADLHAPDIKVDKLGPDFVGIWSDDAHHFVGGRLYVSSGMAPPAGHVLAAEVRVYGIVCGIRDVIAVGMVSPASGPLMAELSGYKQSFVTLGVEVRKFLDGFPSDVPARMSFGIAGRLFR
jgi:hypothetical protein